MHEAASERATQFDQANGEETPGGTALDEPVWSEVGNRLLGGVAHTLSNRAHAVLAIGAGLDDAASPLVSILRDEAARLDDAVRLLRLLVRGDSTQPVPMRAEDLLADAYALHAQRTEQRDGAVTLTVDTDAPPIRVDPTAALHALLIVLDAVSAAGVTALTVTASRDGSRLRVQVTRADAHDREPVAPRYTIPDAALDAASRLLATDGGSVDRDGSAVTIRLPALGGER